MRVNSTSSPRNLGRNDPLENLSPSNGRPDQGCGNRAFLQYIRERIKGGRSLRAEKRNRAKQATLAVATLCAKINHTADLQSAYGTE